MGKYNVCFPWENHANVTDLKKNKKKVDGGPVLA
jgi:hypothetical protein